MGGARSFSSFHVDVPRLYSFFGTVSHRWFSTQHARGGMNMTSPPPS
jgi:hypothetical protein